MSDVHALSGAYAVDALTPQERVEFERHLARCDTCREEVASLRHAVTSLSATTVEEPPASLRSSVLDAIADVRQLPPQVPAAPVRKPRRWIAAAAAVVLVGGIGVGITRPWQEDTSNQQVVSVTDRVLRADDAQRVTQTFPDGAQATLVRSPSVGRAVLVTHDMPDAPTGHSYVVWLQQGEDMVHAATMPKGPDNTVLLAGDSTTATAAGVTVETDPQTTAPTTDPIALFAF